MVTGHINPVAGFLFGCPAATLVALRQPHQLLRGAGVFSSSSKYRRESRKILVFFRQRLPRFMSARQSEIISFRNQLASPFPAPTILAQKRTMPSARLCCASARRWAHSPPSSIGGVVPTGPAIMAPSPTASNSDTPLSRFQRGRLDRGYVQFAALFSRRRLVQRLLRDSSGNLIPSSFGDGIREASHPPPDAFINWTLATICCMWKVTEACWSANKVV